MIKLFTLSHGRLQLIIATTAFCMGIDCPDIKKVIHWGLPGHNEEYVQA